MKNFFSVFLGCFVVVLLSALFFGDLIVNNIWGIMILISLVLTIIISLITALVIRLDRLEEKLDKLLEDQGEVNREE